MVRRSDEGCSATQKLDFLRSRQFVVHGTFLHSPPPSDYWSIPKSLFFSCFIASIKTYSKINAKMKHHEQVH